MPEGNRVAFDELANCGADGFGKMIAGSQSIGAGKKVLATVIRW